ncbi:MAG: hypothetical protein EZS28_026195 [Streblomastix strix]|uniref:Reverse transcriptase domain-containing protein n=1 Tax=Streblomastix strix TaxID=222440 RepID=A0A5J4V644_9EUKA|nr:MAG: hypothetical protein EZS28_026195 [Streblomastix strix]
MKQTIRLGDWSTSLDHSSAFHHLIVQTESQPYLAFEFQNYYYTYRNQEYLMSMTQQVIDTLKYFGFTMNTEKSETEPNQTVIFLGCEWSLVNATMTTKLKVYLLFLHDQYNIRRWTKTGTEIAVKQSAKLI